MTESWYSHYYNEFIHRTAFFRILIILSVLVIRVQILFPCCCFVYLQDVVMQYLTTDDLKLNVIDSEDPEVREILT